MPGYAGLLIREGRINVPFTLGQRVGTGVSPR